MVFMVSSISIWSREGDHKKKICYPSICAAKLFSLGLLSLSHRLHQAGVNIFRGSLNSEGRPRCRKKSERK